MAEASSMSVKTIEPPKGWELPSLAEVFGHKDLLIFLVKRDIKVLYAQTVLGFAWAILNPLIQIIVFSVIFGRLANLESDGYPYFLFSTIAIVPWNYMSNAMGASSQSLVSGQAMLGKVYFPRVIYPITPVLAQLVDFSVSLLLVFAVMAYYGIVPTLQLVYLPFFFVMMVLMPIAVGLWLSSLAIRFRDVKFAMPFLIRMMIYSAPILYAASIIPDQYRSWYSINPIVGVIEGYRACLLGYPVPWEYVWPGCITLAVVLITGAVYFRRMERVVVDVI